MPLPTPCWASVFGYNPNLAEKKNASSSGCVGIGDDQYNTGQDAGDESETRALFSGAGAAAVDIPQPATATIHPAYPTYASSSPTRFTRGEQ